MATRREPCSIKMVSHPEMPLMVSVRMKMVTLMIVLTQEMVEKGNKDPMTSLMLQPAMRVLHLVMVATLS